MDYVIPKAYYCVFNIILVYFRENTNKLLNLHKRCNLEVFAHSENSGSQPWFSVVKMTSVIISRKWNTDIVRRFRNNISNPDNFIGKPPLAVAKLNSNFHLFSLFNYYLFLFLIIYLICLFIFAIIISHPLLFISFILF